MSGAEARAGRIDLARVLQAAARGVYPVSDGGWERAHMWRRGVEAVVAFTGHAFLAVGDDLGDVELEALGVDGYGGAHGPHIAERIRGTGWVDSLDVLLIRPTPIAQRSQVAPDLVARPDLAGHPRTVTAAQVRTGIQVLGLPARRSRSLVTVAQGLGGLPEIGLETHGDQSGRDLMDGALRWVERSYGPTAPVVAAVSPGNARSLRLFLRGGFVPVGSVQLFRPERHPLQPPDG